MSENKLIIAAAGSGKTTHLVNEALRKEDGNVLITTFTIANANEIRKMIIEKRKCVPDNIKIWTWFSFLLRDGVKPYQDYLTKKRIKGMILVEKKSAVKYYTKYPVYYKESNIDKHYFTNDYRIYSDKVSKFVIKCNKLSSNKVINRLESNYSHILIDEIQDLAGYDLELIKLIVQSDIELTMVGDPRQVTYHTHFSRKHKKYSDGNIDSFIRDKCKKSNVLFDKDSLNKSHRCNKEICDFSSELYSDLDKIESNQEKRTGHDGVFFLKEEDIENYLELYKPVQLRNNKMKKVNKKYRVMNFGNSKGKTFDRVLIYPTQTQLKWIFDHSSELPEISRSKFFVALTRAKYSVAIVYNYTSETRINNIQNYSLE